jgi:hypothetical protein
LALALVLGGTGVASARATAPFCGITWGSLPKVAPAMTTAPIVNARVGRDVCWERLVVDLGGMPPSGYNVRYTDGFHQVGSGTPLLVAGGAVLTITVNAPGYDQYGHRTVPWTNDNVIRPFEFQAAGFQTFKDLVYGGSFEGTSDFGLGVRARLPFRVFTLTGPGSGSRLVIDVAPRW